MTDNTPSPLPCPFCGGKPEVYVSHRPAARCANRECAANFGGDRWVWIELWNTRMFDVRCAELLRAAPSPAPEPVVPDAIVVAELDAWSAQVKEAIFYARVAARSKGYALAVHGTLRRDVDLVAIPWTDEACAPDELMEKIVEYLRSVGVCYGGEDTGTLAHARQSREEKPFGRIAYAIPLKGIPAPYLDLSVAPRLAAPSGSGGAWREEWPLANEEERKGGWTYSHAFLTECRDFAEKDCGFFCDLEVVDALLKKLASSGARGAGA